jgi:hypothetical protein
MLAYHAPDNLDSFIATQLTFEFKRGHKRAKKGEPLSMDAPAGEDNVREV